GSKNVERADKCTLINIVNNPDTHLQYNVGNVQGNCEGGTNPVSLTVGGESTTETTTTASADLGIDFEGISIGGGIESSKSTSSTKSNSTTITVNPGRQAVMTMSVLAHSQSEMFKSITGIGSMGISFGSPARSSPRRSLPTRSRLMCTRRSVAPIPSISPIPR
ncbi:hypothetical protein R3P38DRAFT_3023848, partial [Favolaschia claudopus]